MSPADTVFAGLLGEAFADLAHENIFDAPVNAFAIVAKLQKGRLAEQCFKIDVRVFTDQFNADFVELANGFKSFKAEHFEVVANGGDMYREMCHVGRYEHTFTLELGS